MQFKLTAAANIPIVLMNSSTGIPLRTVTFLKTSSAICGLGSCAAWVVVRPVVSRHPINIAVALRTVGVDFNLTVFSFGGQYRLGRVSEAMAALTYASTRHTLGATLAFNPRSKSN